MAFIMRQRRESLLMDKEDDMTASTHRDSLTSDSTSRSGSWSEEDESETSSPLVERINNRPLHHTFTSISSNNQFPKVTFSPSRKTTTMLQKNKLISESDYDLKNSRDVMAGSVSAVVNFLRMAGIPKASMDELDENLNKGHYFDVLCRVQQYVQCIVSESNDEKDAKIHLAVTAWVSLCRLKSLEYKEAYKRTNKLKMEMSSADAKKWKRLQIEMKEALKEQVDLAEQCTSCQKKFYLVQRWEKQHLQTMKRNTIMEPEGYQPLRCLIEH